MNMDINQAWRNDTIANVNDLRKSRVGQGVLDGSAAKKHILDSSIGDLSAKGGGKKREGGKPRH